MQLIRQNDSNIVRICPEIDRARPTYRALNSPMQIYNGVRRQQGLISSLRFSLITNRNHDNVIVQLEAVASLCVCMCVCASTLFLSHIQSCSNTRTHTHKRNVEHFKFAIDFPNFSAFRMFVCGIHCDKRRYLCHISVWMCYSGVKVIDIGVKQIKLPHLSILQLYMLLVHFVLFLFS